MSEEKKWKRGDIGPDGRAFWKYQKTCKNGEHWITIEKYAKKREKELEEKRRYHHENRDKLLERNRRYYQKNAEIERQKKRLLRQEDPENQAEISRRYNMKKSFSRSFVTNLSDFYASLKKPHLTIAAIFKLTPDEGQTLAELIHELSGYPMELCEQIANPPEPEPEPQPEMLDNSPPPVILPDLF